MLKEQFMGRLPSHFSINPIVKAYILSESLVWPAWNFVTPIFALFVANNVTGGNVQVAASAFSVYLVTRVIFELISGRYLTGTDDNKKILITILGTIILSLSYIGFMFTNSVFYVYFFYAISGMGMGIATPAKNSLFSMHLDKNKESTEWGLMDAIVFICTALAAALGGFVASTYGFQSLFMLAAIVNILGVIPYLLHVR